MAAHTIACNISRIIDAKVDTQHLATKLKESKAISEDVYDMVFEESTLPALDKCVHLIDYVEEAVKYNGELFDTLLQAFRELGEVPLADELQQYYSKL